MPNSRFISSPPISSRATASCCRRARPPRRSSPRPRSPALSRRSATGISISPTARSPRNTPIRVAVAKGAKRLIILPTGYACATNMPPVGAVANALHALTLLIARQLVSELEGLGPDIEYFVVPPLCPLVGSPYDFSRTADHIERAIRSTDAWLAQSGLEQGGIPHEMRPHSPLSAQPRERFTIAERPWPRLRARRSLAKQESTVRLHCKRGAARRQTGRIDSPPAISVACRERCAVISVTVTPVIVYSIVLELD